MEMSNRQLGKAVALVGPTASGKSAVVLHLANMLGGEIISVDSMQVYRRLDIGTAKPTLIERARVRHHLIDILDLHETFDVHQFSRLAESTVAEIQCRGRMPLFCGGTGLYLKAWCEGLGTAPASDPAMRKDLEARALPDLVAELATLDPEASPIIDLSNRRRVIRAIEIVRLTGQRLLSQRAPWKKGSWAPVGSEESHPKVIMLGLCRSREDLWRRIDARTEAMIKNGLVEETRRLLDAGLRENRSVSLALGYRQVLDHLQRKTLLKDTLEQIKAATRRYARRQMTWFRHQLPVRWVDLPPAESPEETARRIACLLVQEGAACDKTPDAKRLSRIETS